MRSEGQPRWASKVLLERASWGVVIAAVGAMGIEATVGVPSDRDQAIASHPSAISTKEGEAAKQRMARVRAELAEMGLNLRFDAIAQVAADPEVMEARRVADEWESVQIARAQSLNKLAGDRLQRVIVEALAAAGGIVMHSLLSLRGARRRREEQYPPGATMSTSS